jgi:regulation of enolase protein 1 (concanavalin A-like superfamily)
MRRRGGEFSCAYCVDGKTWIDVKSAALAFSTKASVGISASNLSPKEFEARFEDFSVEQAGKKTERRSRP